MASVPEWPLAPVDSSSTAGAPRVASGSEPERPASNGGSRRFGKRCRLLDKTDYDATFAVAEIKAHADGLLLLARRNALGRPRIGIVVSKRKFRMATARNQLKRQIRESFRQRQCQLPPLDIIALPAARASLMSRRAFRHSMERAWAQLRRKGR